MSSKDKYNDVFVIRGFKEYRPLIDEAMKKNPEKYSSHSHFIRVSIIKQLKKNGVMSEWLSQNHATGIAGRMATL